MEDTKKAIIDAIKKRDNTLLCFVLNSVPDVVSFQFFRNHSGEFFEIAGEVDTPVIVSALRCKMDAVNISRQRDLFIACHSGDFASALDCLFSGVDPNFSFARSTPLVTAAARGHATIVAALALRFGALPDLVDSDQKTPLIHASIGGHLDCIALLLQAGAAVDLPDSSPATALLHACANGRREALLLLHASRASLLSKDSCHHTAVWLASAGGHAEVVAVLRMLGAQLDVAESLTGKTALHVSAEAGHRDCVEELVRGPVELNSRDAFGFTPLMLSILHGHFSVSSALLRAGARFDATDAATVGGIANVLAHFGSALEGTPFVLSTVIQAQSLEMVQLVLSSCVAPKHVLASALVEACDRNSLELVELLLRAGAPPNGVRGKRSPISIAVARRSPVLIRVLLDSGADPNISDMAGETPLSLMIRHRIGGVVEAINAGGIVPSLRISECASALHEIASHYRASVAAFTFGLHRRGGLGSPIRLLSPELAQVIAQLSIPSWLIPFH